MSVRVLLTTGALCGALALLGGCSFGSHVDDSAPAPEVTVSQPPPVGSIEHPRPVDCIDGMTTAVGPRRSASPNPEDTPATSGAPPNADGAPIAGSARGAPAGSSSAPASHGSSASPSSGGPGGRSGADVRVGPVVWRGLRELETGDQHAHGVQNSGGWHYRVFPDVAAGAAVTVTIGAEQRARAGLEYGGGYGTTPAPSVTFHSCPAATTTFPGGFFVAGDGRACVPVDVKVGDAAVQHVVISFFKGRCPA